MALASEERDSYSGSLLCGTGQMIVLCLVRSCQVGAACFGDVCVAG